MAKKTGSRSFGMFRGVFIPTFLSIIGVILFLRLGYVVGNGGILGSMAIILLAVSITFATAMSLSSITTNIRIGAGGAYSIISKTLGLEVGGSVGIPLYLAQTFSVVLYIFGFGEAWRFIFPEHHFLLVVLACFALLFLLTFINTSFAIGAQLIVFFFVLAALAAVVAGGGWWQGIQTVPLVGSFSDMSFWPLFALFFPAVTGLMAGVGMSGELTDPKRQIPQGVMLGLGITTAIYLLMVGWFAYSATPETLIANNLQIVELSAFSPLVLAGILAATFSSALTTLVAAPRVLQAMGGNSVLPLSGFFASKTKKGEPRNATLFTAGIIIVSLLVGNLNGIAPILTMFFLITYAMINVVVSIEQSLGFVSFRPTFRIPRIAPLYGALGSVIVMFLINVIAGILSLLFLLMMYTVLVKRRLQPKQGDVRSGLFLAISEWAARKVRKLPESSEHIWRPNVLLPTPSSSTLLGNYPLIKSVVYPNGTLSVLGMRTKEKKTLEGEKMTGEQRDYEMSLLPELVEKFGQEGIFTTYADIAVRDYINGVCISLQAIEGQFFHPNILFLPFSPSDLRKREAEQVFRTVKGSDTGLALFSKNEEIGLGTEEDIHIWIPEQALEKKLYEDRTFDLAMLVAYRMHRNWAGDLTLWMCVDKDREAEANSYLRRLIYEARFPRATSINVSTGTWYSTLKDAPAGDLHIIPVDGLDDARKKAKDAKKIKKSFLFVQDSGAEDILA